MIKNIRITPRYLGIKATKQGYNKHIYHMGGDTEAYNGRPITIQLCGENSEPEMIWVDENNITKIFLNRLHSIRMPSGCRSCVIWFHNLKYDLPQLFYPILTMFVKYTHFIKKFPEVNAEIDVVCGKTWFCKVRLFKENSKKPYRIFQLLDSMNFLEGGVEKISKVLGLPLKMSVPEGLGEKKFAIEDEYFIKYAKNDSYVEMLIGKYIMNMHKEYDVRISVSNPQLAQRIFTKNFFPKNRIAWLPNETICEASKLSYHGGKNNFILPFAKKIRNVYELDVVSMYPDAMKDLPPWTSGKFRTVFKFEEHSIGVYCISGRVKKCRHPIIASHDFKYYNDEEFEDVWVFSYEIKEALRMKEVEIKKIRGYVWMPDEKAENPFHDYVMHFFNLKKECKDSRRESYKLLLNALYGKLMASIPDEKPNEDKVDAEVKVSIIEGHVRIDEVHIKEEQYRSSGLYFPFIASAITSMVRARIHFLEHKYGSLDTSTDSIKTTKTPDPEDIGLEIGKLKVECYGDCLFFRNKLYIHFGTSIKYATHGFEGSLSDLMRLWLEKDHNYSYRRMSKIKECFRRVVNPDGSLTLIRKADPFVFKEINAKLNVNYYEGELEGLKAQSVHKEQSMLDSFEDDLIDYNALEDSSLTEKENKEIIRRNLMDYMRY